MFLRGLYLMHSGIKKNTRIDFKSALIPDINLPESVVNNGVDELSDWVAESSVEVVVIEVVVVYCRVPICNKNIAYVVYDTEKFVNRSSIWSYVRINSLKRFLFELLFLCKNKWRDLKKMYIDSYTKCMLLVFEYICKPFSNSGFCCDMKIRTKSNSSWQVVHDLHFVIISLSFALRVASSVTTDVVALSRLVINSEMASRSVRDR